MVREWVTERTPVSLGSGASTALTFAVALLSVLTGLVNIATPSFPGPLTAYLPAIVVQAAGFTGALTGFLMLAGAFGLRRGYRAAWWGTVVLLPVTAAQGLLQARLFSYPLVALSLLTLPVLLWNRRHFDREVDLSTAQLASLVALGGAQAYGTLGAFALREEFTGIDSLLDAFYFVLVTGSTVGYGDVTPQSEVARLFVMSALLLNVAAFAVALTVLLSPAIQASLSRALGRMTEQQLELLEDHVIVFGYGELTEPIIEELRDETDFVVITDDESAARRLTERDVKVLTADPSDEQPQLRAGLKRARAAIAATNNDADDALAVLTATTLRPDLHVAAAATQRENVGKLKRAGAKSVISPASIGGHLLVQSAMGSDDTERLANSLLRE